MNLGRRRFESVRSAYWSGIRPDPAITDDRDLYDEITETGIAVRPGFVDGATMDALRAEVLALDGLDGGDYTGVGQFRRLDADGICAVEITPALATAHHLTVANDRLHRLAKALFGAELTSAAILSKYGADRIDSSNVPHWDDWRARFKCFLFVTDVTIDDAPMIYVPRSHRGIPWRTEKDYLSQVAPRATAGGSWWPIEEAGLHERVVCTGPAGTLVAFNALGVHSGTQLVSGPRIMLMSMYTTHLGYSFRPY